MGVLPTPAPGVGRAVPARRERPQVPERCGIGRSPTARWDGAPYPHAHKRLEKQAHSVATALLPFACELSGLGGQILLRELPGGAVFGDGEAGGLGVADDLLGRGVEADGAAELEREQAQHKRHIHAHVIEDAA